MEWTSSLRAAIDYIEKHLLEDLNNENVAESVNISSFYFQKGFKIMTGYTVVEYIRCRRLYMAALDLISGKIKVIDAAYKYGYETPESFTKAFNRFHGVSPNQIKKNLDKIKIFLPLKIIVSIKGGNDMDYVVEKMSAFKVIGYGEDVSFEGAYDRIPKLWNEFQNKFCNNKKLKSVLEENCIGKYAVCIANLPDTKTFRYMIAGDYKGGTVPENMSIYEIPALEWAKFKCTGPMPEALQRINTKIFKEWLPGNLEYEIETEISIEYYSSGDCSSADYESEIWIPVKRK